MEAQTDARGIAVQPQIRRQNVQYDAPHKIILREPRHDHRGGKGKDEQGDQEKPFELTARCMMNEGIEERDGEHQQKKRGGKPVLIVGNRQKRRERIAENGFFAADVHREKIQTHRVQKDLPVQAEELLHRESARHHIVAGDEEENIHAELSDGKKDIQNDPIRAHRQSVDLKAVHGIVVRNDHQHGKDAQKLDIGIAFLVHDISDAPRALPLKNGIWG